MTPTEAELRSAALQVGLSLWARLYSVEESISAALDAYSAARATGDRDALS